MRIQKINDDKIRVIFDYKELKDNNISTHSFLSNSNKAKELISRIIKLVNKKMHFSNNIKEIEYETISFNNEVFILLVTRKRSNKCNNILGYELSSNDVLFEFDSLKQFFDFYKQFKEYLSTNIGFNLYELKSKYYIKIHLTSYNLLQRKTFISSISEFITPIYLNSISNAYFLEKAILVKSGYF